MRPNVITARERNPEAWANWQALIQNASMWTDAHIPRTEKPVRFGWKWHVGGISGNGACWVCLSESGNNGWRRASQA